MPVKYVNIGQNESAEVHGGMLNWPGNGEGFPVRGPAALLKQDEIDELPLVSDFKSQLFKLADPEDKKKFDAIQDRVMDGWYCIRKRIDTDDPVNVGYPIVWLEWVQLYAEVPDKINARLGR